ncbi:MAG: hypothetical protein JXR37_10800 [Kiritimatiellae bacterium]|nr:hypothetical protein [Kiritimatiellia bacterium]
MTLLDRILAIAADDLPAAGVDCLLIGGFAVNHHGYTRNTLDVDFMIVADQLDSVRKIMTQAGFTNVAIRENVAFFSVPDEAPRADFLRVDEQTMRRLLENAACVNVHGHALKIPTVRDLIAMKIFALSQDVPRRMGKDLPDIAYLTVLHELSLEADIRPLCDRFGTDEVYALIRDQVEALRRP